MKFNKNIIKILYIILSITGTIGFIKQYEIGTETNISNNILNIVIVLFTYFLYKKTTNNSKIEKIFSITLSFIISSILIIGSQLDSYSEILWSINTFIYILFLGTFLYPIISYTFMWLSKINLKNNLIITKKTKILTYVIITCSSILVLLALFPGVYGYDAGFQIKEFLNSDTQLTSHFSVIFSFILSMCISIGKALFNSNQIGMAIFSIIQILFMSYVATRITLFTAKKTNNKLIFILSIIFFSIFPLYTVMTVSTAQDTIFGGFFALIVINLIEFHECENKKKWIIKNSIITLLFCCFKNNGYYIILFTIVCILLFYKNKKLLYMSPLIIGIIIYKIYTGPIFTCMNVNKVSPIKEMSSIPSQQLARVYNYNYNVLTKKDIENYEIFYKSLDDFKYYIERQSISDPIKVMLNVENVKKDMFGYIKLWLKIGIKDQKNYIEAFLMNNLEIWYPNKNYNDDRMYHPYIEYDMLDAKAYHIDYEVISRDSKFPLYEKILNKIVKQNKWKDIPVISILFETGTYFILYIYTFTICLIRKKKKYLIPMLAIGCFYITLLLAPVALFRYCFPIVILLPIFITILFDNKTTN